MLDPASAKTLLVPTAGVPVIEFWETDHRMALVVRSTFTNWGPVPTLGTEMKNAALPAQATVRFML